MIPRGVTIYTQSCIIDAMLFKNQFLQKTTYILLILFYRETFLYIFWSMYDLLKEYLKQRCKKNQQIASNEYQMHTFSTTTPITTGLYFGFVYT